MKLNLSFPCISFKILLFCVNHQDIENSQFFIIFTYYFRLFSYSFDLTFVSEFASHLLSIDELKSTKKCHAKKILYTIVLFIFFSCKVQQRVLSQKNHTLTLRYVNHQYNETKNISFRNDELIKDRDTLKINIKATFDYINAQIYDLGVYTTVFLKKSLYTFKLKQICVNDIPDLFNSYYKINTIPDKEDCSKFTEIEKNTEFNYNRNYGEYVDINGILYQIIGISPDDTCFILISLKRRKNEEYQILLNQKNKLSKDIVAGQQYAKKNKK